MNLGVYKSCITELAKKENKNTQYSDMNLCISSNRLSGRVFSFLSICMGFKLKAVNSQPIQMRTTLLPDMKHKDACVGTVDCLNYCKPSHFLFPSGMIKTDTIKCTYARLSVFATLANNLATILFGDY